MKRLGALALLALLLVPPPASVAAGERRSSQEWVWGEWGDEKDGDRRERRGDQQRHPRYHRHDRDHRGYGLVYRSHRDRPRHRYGLTYRPRHAHHHHHHPRPHPCGLWLYDGRPYDQVAHWDDDDFWHWDGRWFPCGPHRPRVRRSTYIVHMTGDQVDPAGPADASGVANLLLLREPHGSRGRICHRLSLRGTDTAAPLAAHLHEGRSGQTGREVFDLDLLRNGRQGCRDVDAWTVWRIERSPASFHLDVHTRTFGTGVVRGQLARAYRG